MTSLDPPAAPLHVYHVNLAYDPRLRDPDALLEAWWSLRDTAAAVAGAGVRCTVFQAFDRSDRREVDGVRFRFVPARRSHIPFSGGRSFGWVRRLGYGEAPPNIIHVHGLVFPIHTAMLARSFRGAVVVQDHGTPPPRGLRRLVCRWGFRRLAGVAFTAREQAHPFFRHHVLRAHTTVFEIPEGTSRFTPGDVRQARAASGVYGDPCLIWLGNLDENKDPLTVLDALSLARWTLPDPHLWCCFRNAPLRQQVGRRIAEDAGLAGRVHLLGYRPHGDVELLLRAGDFFVQGSHRESTGYALIESLACGTPPIVSDIPPFRRLTGDGAIGALFPPGNAGAMAAAIGECVGRDQRALRLATRTRFEQYLSSEALGRAWRSAYQTMLAVEARAGRP